MSVTELYDFINDAATKEYNEQQERIRIQIEQQKKEDDQRNQMLHEINDFFMPLFEPFTYMVDVSSYQTLGSFPFLYIYRVRDDLSIWGSNLEKEDLQDVNIHNMIESWNYDFVKALWDNKENILLNIAEKYGYIRESSKE